MKRHRGKFDPQKEAPYELSRSRIENYVRCPACFYLQQAKGIKYPSIPGFNINEATDILLKRDFDICREKGITHPYLEQSGYGHLIPYQHEDFEMWTQSLHFGAERRMNTVHEETNLKVGGGLDDVWLNTETDQLHIIDYKSTSQKSAGKSISLDDKWKESYKRQMDLYVWVMRRKGFDVSDTGYFLYCDADRFTNEPFLLNTNAVMHFKMSIIPYEVTIEWIEPILFKIKDNLISDQCPNHADECEFGNLFEAVM